MEQRRLGPGDILDDYCPRERRITDHAVVAMIEDEVKQTRCTTCDAEHEYKRAKVPAKRRPKAATALAAEAARAESARAREAEAITGPVVDAAATEAEAAGNGDPDPAPAVLDEGPVRRPLIRATLPRPDGPAERRAPQFTIRQTTGRESNSRGYQAKRQGGNGGWPQNGGGFAGRRDTIGRAAQGHGASARHPARHASSHQTHSRPSRSSRPPQHGKKRTK